MLEATKTLESKGMKVNAIADKSAFLEKVKPLYAENQDRIGKSVIEAFSTIK